MFESCRDRQFPRQPSSPAFDRCADDGAIGTLNRIVNEFLVSDEGKQALLNFGMEPLGGTPGDIAGFMASELVKWRPVAEKLAPE
jgi:hypothetical protein